MVAERSWQGLHPRFVIDAEGRQTAVLLEFTEYKALLDYIAELEDQADSERLTQAIDSHDSADFEDWSTVRGALTHD